MPSSSRKQQKHNSSSPNSRPQLGSDQQGAGQLHSRKSSKYDPARTETLAETDADDFFQELTAPSTDEIAVSSPSPPTQHHAIPSPVLGDFEPARNNQNIAVRHTATPYGLSPPPPHSGNGVLIGGSPPTFASSIPIGGGGQHHVAMSRSPSNNGGRPMSHPNNYAVMGGYMQSAAGQSRDRRASTFSQRSGRPSFSGHPPLPHQPQPHFYSPPDMDFGMPTMPILSKEEGQRPGENGYHCGFHSLGSCGDGPSSFAEEVLLVGYEGGLEVLKVSTRKDAELIGRLDGLSGSVIGAKILPWTFQSKDPHRFRRPLVAVVLHSPVMEGDVQSNTSSVILAGEDYGQPGGQEGSDKPSRISHYQTTVEVFSLKTQERVAILFTSPPVPLTDNPVSPLYKPPEPPGGLQLEAKGKFVVVAIGKSGEIFIFTQVSYAAAEVDGGFRCVGKVWTTVRHVDRRPVSSTSSNADNSSNHVDSVKQPGIALFSLSHRRLAVVPPPTSNLLSFNGRALLSPEGPMPPGLAVHSAPPPPNVTCATDVPEADGLFNRVAREMTQEIFKGADWVKSQGIQAWKSYWNKPSPTNQQSHVNGAMPYMPDDPTHNGQHFPPTHALTNDTTVSASKDPTLVSVYDLQRLVESGNTKTRAALNPLATFVTPLGCSFMSFSPNGLCLLTASRKGDVHVVWDLMRMNHGRAAIGPNAPSAVPNVRQIARFTRMTVANVLDVVWTAPSGRRIAVLTENGTVHVYEMPPSAYVWPAARRYRQNDSGTRAAEDDQDAKNAKPGALSTVGTALYSLGGKAQPLIKSVREQGIAGGTGLSNIGGLARGPAGTAKGAVTAGFSKSLGVATSSVNQMYHAGDNKLHLPSLREGVSPGCVCWLDSRKTGAIAIVAGGVLRIHTVKQRISRGSGRRGAGGVPYAEVSKRGAIEHSLKTIPRRTFAPAVLARLEGQPVSRDGEVEERARPRSEGYWALRVPHRTSSHNLRHAKAGNKTATLPLSFAELQPNNPYQPFHTDRRVVLKAYIEPTGSSSSSVEDNQPQKPYSLAPDDALQPWVFGNDLSPTRIVIGPSGLSAAAASSSLALDDENDDTSERPSGSIIGPGTLNPHNDNDTHSLSTARDSNAANIAGKGEQAALRDAGGPNMESLVLTTRRRRRGRPRRAADRRTDGGVGVDGNGGDLYEEDEADGGGEELDEEGFFEDDCEVLDFAADRVF